MGPDRDERTEHGARPPDLRRRLHFAHSGRSARFEISKSFALYTLMRGGWGVKPNVFPNSTKKKKKKKKKKNQHELLLFAK